MKTLLTPLLLAVALLACDARQPPEYQGVLYFGQGSYLMRFSLHDGSLSVAGQLGDTTIREISALRADNLLIAESASLSHRRVSRISWINLKTGESADLYAGILARYLTDPGVLVYDDGSDLFAVPRQDGTPNEIIFSHPQNQLTRLIEASPGILLFEAGDVNQPVIHSWNARTGLLRKLEALAAACSLQGAVWIDPLQRLACKRRAGPVAGADFVLADLDGTVDGKLNLPADKQFLALSYIGSQHALVLQETWRGLLGTRDKHAVWMYDIRTGARHRLAANVNLGNSVVYAE
jgi:hypothetical protein